MVYNGHKLNFRIILKIEIFANVSDDRPNGFAESLEISQA